MLFVNLQRRDVFGDVCPAQGYYGQMAKKAFAVNGNGGGLRTEVYQYTSTSFLRVGQHAVGQGQWRNKHIGNGDAGVRETLFEVSIVAVAPKNV